MKKTILLLSLMAVLVACQQPEEKTVDVEYATMKVKKQDITQHYSCSASLQGEQDVDIIPQAAGTLMEIKVKPGDHVSRGQVLFVINQVPSQAELRVATADVKVARAAAATAKMNLESKRYLKSKNIVSDIQVKKAENEYATALASIEQAEARVTNAQQNLSFTRVTAPCDGIVGEIPYRVGALVGPEITTPLTIVSNNKRMFANIALTEAALLQFMEQSPNVSAEQALKALPPVQLRTSIGSMYPQEGRIESLSGVINRTTGTMSARAIFPNPNGMLRSGGVAEVILPVSMKGVIVIPQSATTTLQDKTFVYKVVDNKAVGVEVSVAATDDNQNYVVLKGLNEGDVIVKDGAGNVTEGEEIKFKMAAGI